MSTTKTIMPKAPAKKTSSREKTLARVEAVRLGQREQGHFDCFGRAASGYCDQRGCSFHAECLSVSQLIGVAPTPTGTLITRRRKG